MKKNKRVLLKTIIFIIFVIFVLLIYIYAQNETRHKNKAMYDEKEWAYCNYGQLIEGVKGVSGVDINIKGINEFISKEPKGALVAVVDTGIYFSKTNEKYCWKNTKEVEKDGIDNDGNGYIDDSNGWDFYNNDANTYDNYLYDYHGTYIANTILSISSETKIIPCKFLRGTTGDTSDAIKAIKYAIDNNATIINYSWNFEREDEELYRLMKSNPNILFVCAAGNSNLDLDQNNLYPVCYKLDNVISVMSIDNKGEIYEYSGYGKSVDIAAPGKNIYVNLPENDKTYVDGTSVSAAFVTGTAALLKSIDSSITSSEMKRVIMESAHKLDGLGGKCKTEGCLDICNSIKTLYNEKRR